jgi:hypothetical protein
MNCAKCKAELSEFAMPNVQIQNIGTLCPQCAQDILCAYLELIQEKTHLNEKFIAINNKKIELNEEIQHQDNLLDKIRDEMRTNSQEIDKLLNISKMD